MDEIWLEKALDKVGVVWLTFLFSVVLSFGKVPLDFQPGVMIPNFKKGDKQVHPIIWESHSAASQEKPARSLERSLHSIVVH